MSLAEATDLAWFAVPIGLIVLIGFACWALAKVSGVLTEVRDKLDDAGKESVARLRDAGEMMMRVNRELDRVDGILVSAEHVAQTTGHVVTVVSDTVTSPLVKLSAFAWGLRKAVGAAGDEDGEAPRRGRGFFRRRR